MVHVNQTKAPGEDETFHVLGVYEFTAGEAAVVTVSNAGSDGYVVIDAVQWIQK